MNRVSIDEICIHSKNIKWNEISDAQLFSYVDLTSVDRESCSIVNPQKISRSNAPSRAQRIIKSGDVIFATTRPTLRRLCVIPNNYNEQICSTGFCVLRPKQNIALSKWIFFMLSADVFYDYINPLQTGATYPAISDNDVRAFKIPLPSLSEQQRIVDILDAEFAKIDTLKANAEKSLQNAKDLFQSALSKELEPKEGWVTKLIPDISENLDKNRIPVTKKDRENGKFPYYGASGIVDYVNEYIFDGKFLLVSEDGANLIARTIPIAFSISGKTWVNNHAHVLRFDDENLQYYVEYYFIKYDLSDLITGTAQPKLTQNALNSIKVSFPSDKNQISKIVIILNELKERCNTLQDNYTKTITLCDDMKQSLLRKAFNGDL
ncbi:MAG: restriction endonuclease subunit S [Paludibacteraceae bacterium]|nr:restriction endonuclease subunit S [Paludibacteraceae bacterium]